MAGPTAKERWLTSADYHDSGKGIRFDLRFYVYPDGHGNIQHRESTGAVKQDNQPANDIEEAVEILRAMWSTATALKNEQSQRR